MQAGNDPRALHIEEADQLECYFPPTVAHGAVLSFDSISGPGAITRKLKVAGVSIFSRRGIGVQTPPGEALPPWIPVVPSEPLGPLAWC